MWGVGRVVRQNSLAWPGGIGSTYWQPVADPRRRPPPAAPRRRLNGSTEAKPDPWSGSGPRMTLHYHPVMQTMRCCISSRSASAATYQTDSSGQLGPSWQVGLSMEGPSIPVQMWWKA